MRKNVVRLPNHQISIEDDRLKPGNPVLLVTKQCKNILVLSGLAFIEEKGGFVYGWLTPTGHGGFPINKEEDPTRMYSTSIDELILWGEQNGTMYYFDTWPELWRFVAKHI